MCAVTVCCLHMSSVQIHSQGASYLYKSTTIYYYPIPFLPFKNFQLFALPFPIAQGPLFVENPFSFLFIYHAGLPSGWSSLSPFWLKFFSLVILNMTGWRLSSMEDLETLLLASASAFCNMSSPAHKIFLAAPTAGVWGSNGGNCWLFFVACVWWETKWH